MSRTDPKLVEAHRQLRQALAGCPPADWNAEESQIMMYAIGAIWAGRNADAEIEAARDRAEHVALLGEVRSIMEEFSPSELTTREVRDLLLVLRPFRERRCSELEAKYAST